MVQRHTGKNKMEINIEQLKISVGDIVNFVHYEDDCKSYSLRQFKEFSVKFLKSSSLGPN